MQKTDAEVADAGIIPGVPARIPLPDPLRAGPFTTAEALAAGLGPKRIRGRDLRHPFRGVHSASSELDLVGLCRARRRTLPAEAYFCGATAAALMGVPLPVRLERSRTLEIAVPSPRRAPGGRGVRGHSFATGEGDVRDWHGLRISTPERLWCELGAVLSLPDLVAAGDFLIHRRLPHTTVEALAEALTAYPGRRGLRVLTGALPLLDERTESAQESRMRVIVARGGLGGFEVNLPITTADGFRYRGDLAFPKERVLLE